MVYYLSCDGTIAFRRVGLGLQSLKDRIQVKMSTVCNEGYDREGTTREPITSLGGKAAYVSETKYSTISCRRDSRKLSYNLNRYNIITLIVSFKKFSFNSHDCPKSLGILGPRTVSSLCIDQGNGQIGAARRKGQSPRVSRVP